MSEGFLLVGHRGWPARHPENTLTGFIAASGVADMVELDVRRCSDGRLVVAHDPVLEGHVICETPWSVLAEIDVGGGTHPALLDEVLAALPETPIQLEVKNSFAEPGFEPDGRIGLETAERARPRDIVTSFNPETLWRIRQTYPDVRTGLAVDSLLDMSSAADLCRDAGHKALIPNHELIMSEIDIGVEIYPWTVNDEDRAVELVELGVTGIITDDPGLLSKTVWRENDHCRPAL